MGTQEVECRHCREMVRGDLDNMGARCPRCRFPLFERPERGRRPPRSMANAGPCVVHDSTPAVARCRRCEQLVCGICRTRWQEEILCLDCFNRALETGEPLPRESKQQRLHGRRSLVWAILSWVLFLTSLILLLNLREGGTNKDLTYLAFGLFFLSLAPALTSVGQSFAVIRSRGHAWQLATWSFLLAGLQLGTVLGLVLLNVWHN